MQSNRICVITGANSGIGQITAQALAKKGFDVVMLCRNLDKARPVQQAIQQQNPTVRIDLIQCDLARLASVREAARQVQEGVDHIDVLINNAGLYIDTAQYSPDGFELTFATNHLGPFLLTTLLLDHLRRGQDARIVTVSSDAHRLAGDFRLDELTHPSSYSGLRAYSRSKLCNILFANELAHRLMDDGITSNSVHPGFVDTNFGGDLSSVKSLFLQALKPLSRTAEAGADTSIWLAASPEVEHVTGLYLTDRKPKTPSKDARNGFYQKQLWTMSEKLINQ